MTIRTTFIASSLIAASLISGAAQAALMGRDLNGSVASFEAYYDTDLNITWLATANLTQNMSWVTASTWAANLSFTDGANVYNNWRLPNTLQPDASCGNQPIAVAFNCTGSEMGHLFYNELGGTAGQSILTSSDPDLAKFSRQLGTTYYWSATVAATEPTNAYLFSFGNGFQNRGYRGADLASGYQFYALAVSPGDVGAVPDDVAAVPEPNGVPEPATLLLVGLGLVGLGAMRRRG